jgi:hypothetical protein
MTACDITSTIVTPLATTVSAAASHRTPTAREIGWVSCGSSA